MISDTLDTLICARYPLVMIDTSEEGRALAMIQALATKQGKGSWTWSCTKGLLDSRDKPVKTGTDNILAALKEVSAAKPSNGLVVTMLDPHKQLDNVVVNRMFRDLATELRMSNKTIILLTPTPKIPPELTKAISLLDMPLPTVDELREIFDAALKVRQSDAELFIDDPTKQRMYQVINQYAADPSPILQALRGLTLDEAENVICKGIVDINLSPAMVAGEKQQIVKKAGILEYVRTEESLTSIGGLQNLKAWCLTTKKRYTPAAKSYGLEPPKGVMLIGPPGTGKSLTAKVLSAVLDQPLLKVSIAQVASKMLGETTRNLHAAFRTAEAVAPSCLWFDEFEKMFPGGNSSQRHEEYSHANSEFLTHFQECTYPILRIATCNDHTLLDAPVLQRFDAVFFVDLPQADERAEIIAIHLRKRGRDPAKFDIPLLVRETDGLAGREIEKAILNAMAEAFAVDKEVATDHIQEAITKLTASTRASSGQVDAMREWARDNAVPASVQPVQQKTTSRTIEAKV